MLRNGPVRAFSPEVIEQFRRLLEGYDAAPVPLILLQSERIEWMREQVAAHDALQRLIPADHSEIAAPYVSDTAELLAASENTRARAKAARMRSAALRAATAASVAAAQQRLVDAQRKLLAHDIRRGAGAG